MDLLADDDRFALRFYYSATLAATGERYGSDVDFDYRE